MKGENESSQKKYVSSLELLEKALKEAGGNVDLQARVLYAIQQTQFESGNLVDALERSNQLVALKPVVEQWVTPHAWFKLGQIHAKSGRVADARRAFEKVGEYDDYDFQDRLESRVDAEMKKLQ